MNGLLYLNFVKIFVPSRAAERVNSLNLLIRAGPVLPSALKEHLAFQMHFVDAFDPHGEAQLLLTGRSTRKIQMSDSNSTNFRGVTVLGVLLAFGLITGGWALGSEIKSIRLGDRYVSVRGLAERTVKSDLAIWPISYKEAGDDLPSLYAKTEADRKVILQFLSQQGIPNSEIELGVVRVVDNQANEFGGNNHPLHRYIVEQQITVTTGRIDQIAAAAQKTTNLLQSGIVLDTDRGQGLAFRFTGLNSVKPDMITEATKNARAVADRFALDSSSKVGSIRQAYQGVFSILPANVGGDTGVSDGASGYSYNADASLMKTVRVVTSVEYYLEK